MARRRHAGATLDDRLAGLADAVSLGEGVVDEAALAVARALVVRAGERLGHGLDHTVVALAGATGSGKSSLFNALAGADLSTVGVRRPTTSRTSAASWGPDATALLDWLHVDRRHVVDDARSGAGALDGLVLLDLPDHDSTAAEHRREVDRVVALADVVVWVLDPQKYADRAVHEDYLRPLAGHAGVLLVTLHQADRLAPDALDACRADLGRLLAADGLEGVPVLATSVRSEGGTRALEAALAERVAARRSAVARLGADVVAAATALGRDCAATDRSGRAIGGRARTALGYALAGAAGVDTVADAVARSHAGRAVAATGWPVTRWVRRLRPDPLGRLHLGTGEGSAARTSLPTASPVAAARLDNAVRDLASTAGAELPLAWSDALRDEVGERHDRLADRLDAAVAGTDLGAARAPAWWRLVGTLQALLLVLAVVGGVWLAGLAALAYLQLHLPEPPDAGPFPLPTALLLGGLAAGVVVAAVARAFAGIGARRRARGARRRLVAAVQQVAEQELVGPIEGVLERNAAFCAAVRRAAGD